MRITRFRWKSSSYHSNLVTLLLLLLFSTAFLLSGCVTPEESDLFSYTPPEEQGMDSELLNEMISYINEKLSGIHSVLVIRHGRVVKENYFGDEWGNNVTHELYSCTKSITSALVGIAIDKGFFELDDRVIDFFPDKEIDNVDEWKQNMTVKHLLQMRSGIEWDEWSTDYMVASNPVQQMLNSDDWAKFVLDKPMAAEPGTEYVYNTGVSHLLSAIIQQTANMTTLSFAQQYLFDPLDIEPGNWLSSPNNVVWGGAGLQLTPRNMAKFGYLYLNNGSWEGTRVVPEEWVIQSTREYLPAITSNEAYYGFQWWIYPERFGYFMFTASGYLGQWITVFPDLDLVVVFTADYTGRFLVDLLVNYIIPAVNA